MSAILNSSEDNANTLNNNAFVTMKPNHVMINENHQQTDSTLSKKCLTEHRGNIKINLTIGNNF